MDEGMACQRRAWPPGMTSWPPGRPVPARRARLAHLRWLAPGAIAILAGCAPLAPLAPLHVPIGTIEPGRRAERYGIALERRVGKGAAVDAQLLLWAEAPVGSRLPGAEGRLLLAAPDAFRLRVGSLFGTALDLGARGDSLSAYVPSRRRALMLDAIRDTLGLRQPGRLAYRALSATWRPPDDAWGRAAWEDSLMRISWLEHGDTLAIAVGSAGLPVWVTFARPDGAGLRVDYQGWDLASGVAWPVRFTIEDRAGAFRIAGKVARVRFPGHADSLRLAVAIPTGTVRLTLAELRRAIERLGTL